MRSTAIRFLLFAVALWLPVQAIAAIAMPMCRHALEQPDTTAPCHESSNPDPVVHGSNCDNCEMCHFAGASFIPSALLPVHYANADRGYQVPATVAPPSYIGDPPQHPPRGRT
jgi:hypothetical protein